MIDFIMWLCYFGYIKRKEIIRTRAVYALHNAKAKPPEGRIFISKAIIQNALFCLFRGACAKLALFMCELASMRQLAHISPASPESYKTCILYAGQRKRLRFCALLRLC